MKPGNVMTVNIKKKSPSSISHDDGLTPHHDHDAPLPHHDVNPPKSIQKQVKITIPKGVKAGNTVTVNLPDGRKIVVKVPKGLKPGNTMTVNYDEQTKPPPTTTVAAASHSKASPPPPPPPSTRDQYVMITVPDGEGPGSKLQATFHGNTFVITVPEGVGPGQKIKVKVPFTVSFSHFF
jgi:hypothetical protein